MNPAPEGSWGSVRGLKCLQRQDFTFNRTRARSTATEEVQEEEEEAEVVEEGGGAGRRREEPEVMLSEVLVLESRSGELSAGGGAGEEAGCSGSGSESRFW